MKIACQLTDAAMAERKHGLQEKVFAQVRKVEELQDGFRFHFDDDEQLLTNLFHYIQAEKACCPFFQQEVVICSHQEGIFWKVCGEEGTKELLGEMLSTIDFPKAD